MDGWINGLIDGWMDGWIDNWIVLNFILNGLYFIGPYCITVRETSYTLLVDLYKVFHLNGLLLRTATYRQ